MFDELRRTFAYFVAGGREPESWRFSPEGWDELRREIDALSSYVQWSPGARIEKVLGLPYTVTCQLPPHIPFELI